MTLGTARRVVLCLAVFAVAVPSSAQVFTGRIDVTVTDSTGAILPNATVTLSGPLDRTAVTDERGEVRFVSLPPGTYSVNARTDGFNEYTNTNVPVVTGGVVPLRVALSVAGVAAQVEVTASSPVIDPKRLATSTNVTVQELQNIPTSRDPWVVLQTVPGVVVDRVNVGGAESGQQSVYKAKGADRGDNTWNIDGVPVTDMAALGSSPTYYDFDMFQEIQVTTGGADLTNATPGVALNFVLKGGSNTPHGSTRYYHENEDMQANNLSDAQKIDPRIGGTTGRGNRIDAYKDYGFELGGPVLRDRLWAWGAYGKTDVTVLTLAGTPDQTILDNVSFKGTGQLNDAIRGSFTYFRGNKKKYGRGAAVTRPRETTWNQKGPSPVYKAEGNFVVGSDLFLTGRYGYVGGGFSLTPQGGLDTNWYFDDSGTHRGSIYQYETVRPQWSAATEGNWFRGRHELKFGFGWRRADVDSTTIVPGNGIFTQHDGYPNMIAEVAMWLDNTSSRGEYTYAFLGDTIAWDRLTLSAGVRWDRGAGSVKGRTQPGHPALPDLLPTLTGRDLADVIVQNAVTPRVGVTYALDRQRKTLARASYGMIGSQLSAAAANFLSAVVERGVYFYGVTDRNGNRVVDAAELGGRTCNSALANAGECSYYGFDIDNLSNAESVHEVGSYAAPLTHEVQVGLDRELLENFGISGTFTWRRFTNFNWRNNGVVGTDYQQIGAFTGSHPAVGNYNVPIYGVRPDRIPANRAATTYRSRPDYYQRFLGLEVAATKRLSNRWMARLGFSTNDHREYFDSLSAITDPTPSPATPNMDGGEVVTNDTASGKVDIWQVLPKYQLIATGMYQAPWQINFGVNLLSRQGYARPYNYSLVPTPDPLAARKTVLLVDEVAQLRLPMLTSLDFRVGKEFSFNRARFNVDLDVFNLLNTNTVLLRQYDLRVTAANDVLEIMNPLVLRVGVRFNF